MGKKAKKKKNIINNTPFHNGMTCTVDLLGRVSVKQGSKGKVTPSTTEQQKEQK